MQVRHDEADARQQLAGMPLRLRHDLTRGAPTLRTVADARVEAPHVMRWPTHRAREQVSSRLWSTWLAGRRIAYWEVIRLQVLVHLGQREGRIAAQQAPEAPAATPSHHRVEHFAPAVRTVHAARCTAVSVRMAFVARTVRLGVPQVRSGARSEPAGSSGPTRRSRSNGPPERARHWGSRRRTASSSCFGGSAGGENRKRFSSVSCSAKSTVRSGCSPGGRMSERWSFARTLFAKKPV